MDALHTYSDYYSTIPKATFPAVVLFEPKDEQQALRGNLYLLFDLSPSLYPLGKMITKIFESEYYQKNPKDKPLSSLEKTLGIVNRKLQGFLQTRQEKEYVCTITVAVFHQNIVHLVQIGDANVFLLRQGSLKKIGNVRSTSSSTVPQFQNIATGGVQEGDTLLMATANLLQVVDFKKLKQIVAANYPTTAIAHIKELPAIQAVKDPLSIFLAEFTLEEKKDRGFTVSPLSLEHDSSQTDAAGSPSSKKTIIESLSASGQKKSSGNDESKNIEELGDLGKWKLKKTSIEEELHKLEQDIQNELSSYKKTTPRNQTPPSHQESSKLAQIEEIPPPTQPRVTTTDPEHLRTSLKSTPLIEYSVIERFKNTFILLGRASINVVQKLAGFQKNLSQKVETINWQEKKEQTKQYVDTNFQSLSKVKKSHWFLVLGLLSTVFLILVLVFTFREQQRQQTIATLLSSAKKNYQSALDYLKNNDVPNSRQALALASSAGEKILVFDKNHNETLRLLNDIHERLDKIDGIVRVTDLKPFTDLSTIDKKIEQPATLLLIDQLLYILDSRTDKLYSYSLANNKLQLKLEAPAQAKNLISATAMEQSIYLYSARGAVNEYNTSTEQLRTIQVAFGGSWEIGEKMYGYNNTFYILDTNRDQIWRHRPVADSVAPATRYFETASVSLAGTTDLGIDGDVYILKNNGQLIRCTATKQPDTTFSVSNINPPLEKPVALYLGLGQNDNIFIAEPSQNRIIEINKNGQFQHQYLLENTSTISIADLVVDYSRNILYFLSGTEIYRINLIK